MNNNQQATEFCPRAKYFNGKKLQKAEFDADTAAFLISPTRRASPSVAFIWEISSPTRRDLRGCLHEPYRKGWPYSARSRVLFEILIKNCLGLHEKRASPPRRDLAIAYPRSRLVGLEISHINATEGAGPPSRAE